MSDADSMPTGKGWRAFEPLKERSYRRIWSASLLSNFGQLILGVGAAWEMTSLTSSASMVALVQTALMLPLMLFSVPAGAIADMFDRRKVALAGLAVASICAATLTALAYAGLTTPWVLLAFCALIGIGVAIYGPAWQASVTEQVSAEHLPAAVALGSISYNIARSVGPAIGGLIVLAAGATAAFAINAVFYLPLLFAFLLWRRQLAPPRLPPERIVRAIISGTRYVLHAPPIRIVLLRALIFGLAGASITALTPLIARDQLHGDASVYGLLLGAFGLGAVGGAMLTSDVRERFRIEQAATLCTIATGAMVVVMGLSHSLWLTGLAMMVTGAVWMLLMALLNVAVQLSSPRWVTARALAWFQAALTGGIAVGAWIWGHAVAQWGVGNAYIASGVVIMLLPLLGLLLPLPAVSAEDVQPVDLGDEPEVGLALTMRSGPIVLEIDYYVDPDRARDFYEAMLKVQQTRLRNGGFNWSLARDVTDPSLWTESYHCPTWGDYLRQRARFTQADLDLQAQANAFHQGDGEDRVRRRLERPFGSVRWRADTPDPRSESLNIFTP
jgi:MFS family permease